MTTPNIFPAPTPDQVQAQVPPDAQLAEKGVIDFVPGIERPEPITETPTSTVEAKVGSRENPAIVDDPNFKGDPRRVIGHPSNPTNSMSQAYADERNQRSQ